jgi:hypothetical protein
MTYISSATVSPSGSSATTNLPPLSNGIDSSLVAQSNNPLNGGKASDIGQGLVQGYGPDGKTVYKATLTMRVYNNGSNAVRFYVNGKALPAELQGAEQARTYVRQQIAKGALGSLPAGDPDAFGKPTSAGARGSNVTTDPAKLQALPGNSGVVAVSVGAGRVQVTELKARQIFEGGKWKSAGFVADGVSSYVDKPIAVGQKAETHGYHQRTVGQQTLITDTKGAVITDLAKAKLRVVEMMKNNGLTTVTHETRQRTEKLKPTYTGPVDGTSVIAPVTPVKPPKDMAQMTPADRLKYMVQVALPLVPENVAKELQNMLTPQSLAMAAAFTGAQFLPVVNVLANTLAVVMLGKDAIDTGGKLVNAITKVLTVNTSWELYAASKDVAEAATHMGSTVVQGYVGAKVKSKVQNRQRSGPAVQNLENTIVKFRNGKASADELRRAVIAANQERPPTKKADSSNTSTAPNTAPASTPKADGSTSAATTAAQGKPPAKNQNATEGTRPPSGASSAERTTAQKFIDSIATPEVRAAVQASVQETWAGGGKVDAGKLKAFKTQADASYCQQTAKTAAQKTLSDPALQDKLAAALLRNGKGDTVRTQALAADASGLQKLAQSVVMGEVQTAAFAGAKMPKNVSDAFAQKAVEWASTMSGTGSASPVTRAKALEGLIKLPAAQAELMKAVLVDQMSGTSAKQVATLAKTDPATAAKQNTLRQGITQALEQNYPSASSQRTLLAEAGSAARTDVVRTQVAVVLGGSSPLGAAVSALMKKSGLSERKMIDLVSTPASGTALMKSALISETRAGAGSSQTLTPQQQVTLRKAIDKKLNVLPNEAAKQQYLKDLSNSGRSLKEMAGVGNTTAPSQPSTKAGSSTGNSPATQNKPRDTAGDTNSVPGGAIVLSKPAAVSFDIPPPKQGGSTRVGSVYGTVNGVSNGMSDAMLSVMARTLKQANPASYAGRSTDSIVADLKGASQGSLTVVVRDKNIAGSSPQSDSVATRVSQATPDETMATQLLAIKDGNAFGGAVSKIRLGAAKIYETPPSSASAHKEALANHTRRDQSGFPTTPDPKGGTGYGYVGQVVGTNLRGSGGQAMAEVMNLARAANMRGLTLYTNNEAAFYSKLGFEAVAVTQNSSKTVRSTHMVWENPNYNPNKTTLRLDNPAVVNALKNPPDSWGRPKEPPPPSGSGGGSPTPTGPTNPAPQTPSTRPGAQAKTEGTATAREGTPSATGQVLPATPNASDIKVSFNGVQTAIVLQGAKAKANAVKNAIYENVSATYNAKVEGPVLDFAAKVGSGIQQRVVAPSARALNDKILSPALDSPLGQRVVSMVDSGAAQFKTAAFETKLRMLEASNSDVAMVLKDMANIAKTTGQRAVGGTFNAIGKAGKTLQTALPGVAASTAVILTNAAATGQLRVVRVAGNVAPTGEALMVKKALNIPNGLSYTYLISDVPGTQSVGGRAIFAFGGGGSAVVTPATGPGQAGVSQPWVGKRSDGSVVTTATGAAYGPNAFVGYSLGTTNFNISDVYAGQLGRVSTNPASASGGGTRPSGRAADFKLGVIAADLSTFNHASVLNAGPAALTFNRYRDPLSLKGTLGSTENKYLVLMPKTKPNGQTYYTPLLDPTLKGNVSQIEPVIPLTGSTTFDPKAKDIAALGNLTNQLKQMLPQSGSGSGTPTVPTPEKIQTAPPVKRRSDYPN